MVPRAGLNDMKKSKFFTSSAFEIHPLGLHVRASSCLIAETTLLRRHAEFPKGALNLLDTKEHYMSPCEYCNEPIDEWERREACIGYW
jgi:cytidine deaminase